MLVTRSFYDAANFLQNKWNTHNKLPISLECDKGWISWAQPVIWGLPVQVLHNMMTWLNGNIFRVTGHLCGEFTGHWWIPRTKASDAELWCILSLVCAWINDWVNNGQAGDLRRHRAHYDVIVMMYSILCVHSLIHALPLSLLCFYRVGIMLHVRSIPHIFCLIVSCLWYHFLLYSIR